MSNASHTAVKPQIPEGPLLSQLAGMPEARAWGEALIQDLVLYKAGRLAWSEIDPGCVLYGPPGTGKTTLARAIAATAKVPLIATSYADWTRGGRFGSDIIMAMGATFSRAREQAPCIVAIDELDSIPARDSLSSEHPVTYAIVNSVLEQLDGLNRRPGVIVIGTCNHLDRLDEALLRSGRLGRSILVPLPALEALPQILTFHLGRDAAYIGDLSGIAVMAVGMSGADIEQLVRDARQRARRAVRSIRKTDLVEALEARSKARDPATEWRIAVHEAGHAVADLRLGVSSCINVSIVAAADSAGRHTPLMRLIRARLSKTGWWSCSQDVRLKKCCWIQSAVAPAGVPSRILPGPRAWRSRQSGHSASLSGKTCSGMADRTSKTCGAIRL